MTEFRFRLAIGRDEYLSYYQGHARAVLVRADDGRRVQFPASALRAFVSHDGVHGEFLMRVGSDGRLQELRRL